MKKVSQLLAIFVLLVPCTVNAQDSDALYDTGEALYRQDQHQESIEVLRRFIHENPDSDKSDDARWYLGKSYRHLGDSRTAKGFFLAVLEDADSNRRTEALHDLVTILDDEDREEQIIPLAESVMGGNLDDAFMIQALPTILKSYNLVGLRYRGEGLGARALEYWSDALDVLGRVDYSVLDPEDREALMEYRVKFALRIASLAKNDEQMSERLDIARQHLRTLGDVFPENEEIEGFQRDIELYQDPKTSLDYRVLLLGGYNGLLGGGGAYADLSVGGSFTLSTASRVGWELDYRHDPFALKTFNFNPAKSGNARLFQRKQVFDYALEMEFGNKYFFQQVYGLTGDLTLAEDPGDRNYGWDLSWDLSIPTGLHTYLEWDNSLSLSLYPDYSNAGRQIDSLAFGTKPTLIQVLSPGHVLEYAYALDYKYYLNAKYDTQAGGTDPDNRRYLTQEVFLDYENELLDPFGFDIAYSGAFLKSFHYDLWIYGNPDDLFIRDYFDYFRNVVGIDASLDLGTVATDLEVEFGLRNFLNYEARNSDRDFTGEKRVDTNIAVSSESEYEIFDRDDWGKLSAVLELVWEQRQSNHTYETTYVTNYSNWHAVLGLEWKD